MTYTTREFFGFRDRDTGELVHLEETESGWLLTRDQNAPVFEVRDADQLANVLIENTRYYNTSPELPGWGIFKEAELIAVKARLTLEMQDVELARAVKVATLEMRPIPDKLALMYAGGCIDKKPGVPEHFVFWLVELPEGETLESMRERAGTKVYGGDRWTGRLLYAALPVPEEYIPLTQGKRTCALLIASGTRGHLASC